MIKKMLAVIGLSLVVVSMAWADDPLDAAKRLYLAASYEEALASLASAPSDADPDQVDKLRALCLLALSRREEATKSLESLAARRPMLQLDDSESPKLVLLFREARLRVLPPATKSLYAAAKGSYEKGELETAKQQFGDVLTLLAEPEMVKLPESADLRMLAEGFARLVDQQLARPSAPAPAAAARSTASRVAPPAAPSDPGSVPLSNSPATATTRAAADTATPSQAVSAQAAPAQAAATLPPSSQPAPAQTAPAQTAPAQTAPAQTAPAQTQTAPPQAAPGQAVPAAPPPAAAAEPIIFTEADQGVTPPVPVEQRLPPWVPPADLSGQSFSGLVEVVINENGRVISALITKSVNATYDALLVNAAKRWQYRPALRNGRGVRFRRVVSIVLSPTK